LTVSCKFHKGVYFNGYSNRKKLLNYPSLYITDEELAATLQLGIFQRHGLVKRALQKKDLIRVRRGLYCIGESLTKSKPNPYVLAQKIY